MLEFDAEVRDASVSLGAFREVLARRTAIAPAEQLLLWIGGGGAVRLAEVWAVEAMAPVLDALEEQRRMVSGGVLVLVERCGGRPLALLRRVLSEYAIAMRATGTEAAARVRALGTVPVARLVAEAEARLAQAAMSGGEGASAAADVCGTAALVAAALRWFKREHFRWVQRPPCRSCGGDTVGAGVDAPNAQEAQALAGTVELYRCAAGCPGQTRFARYNDAAHLLTASRCGRCGEWAQAFTLALRVCGMERVRMVFDFEDHVWTEFWSDALERWVHADACEEALDQPLLYARGWGKCLSWVLGMSARDDANAVVLADRSRQYTPREQWSEMDRRRQQHSGHLHDAHTLLQLLASLLGGDFDTGSSDPEPEEECAPNRSDTARLLLPRQSGAPEWITQRGEDGCRK